MTKSKRPLNPPDLEMHNGKWRVTVSVPNKLQVAFGKTKLKQGLGTDSVSEANRLKVPIVAAFRQRINDALQPQDNIKKALVLAKMRKVLVAAGSDTEILDNEIEDGAYEIAGPPIGTYDDGSPMFHPEKDAESHQFNDIAKGNRTPLDASRKTYLKQIEGISTRAINDDIRAFGYLTEWCKREGVQTFRETFKTAEAVRFTDAFYDDPEERSLQTLNKYIKRLGVYWNWMKRRGEVEANVWQGLTHKVAPKTADERRREFTDDEMVKLLSGSTTQELHDLIRIGALTGARLDVMVCLSVKDCQGGVISFEPRKGEVDRRTVPIHPDLQKIFERRMAGKQPTDDLFPEWPPLDKSERSSTASGQFSDYRLGLGISDKVEGSDLDRVNFHSFRRWFITKAANANQQGHIVSYIVGHAVKGMTMGTYLGERERSLVRHCVEAVRLPDAEHGKIIPRQPPGGPRGPRAPKG